MKGLPGSGATEARRSVRTELMAGLPADWKALKSCVPRRCWAASCMASTSKQLQGARGLVGREWPAGGSDAPSHPSHPHSLCLQCPAPVPLKHGQVVMPGAASDQTVQVGPGYGCMAGMEVTGYSESLQYPVGARLHTPEGSCHPPKWPLGISIPPRESFLTSGLHPPVDQSGDRRWVLTVWPGASGGR